MGLWQGDFYSSQNLLNKFQNLIIFALVRPHSPHDASSGCDPVTCPSCCRPPRSVPVSDEVIVLFDNCATLTQACFPTSST